MSETEKQLHEHPHHLLLVSSAVLLVTDHHHRAETLRPDVDTGELEDRQIWIPTDLEPCLDLRAALARPHTAALAHLRDGADRRPTRGHCHDPEVPQGEVEGTGDATVHHEAAEAGDAGRQATAVMVVGAEAGVSAATEVDGDARPPSNFNCSEAFGV